MSIPDHVTPSAKLPSDVDVAIIGGGIIGCSAAYFLARQGVSVALFEKGEIACEQSSRNWGYCRQQGRDPHEIPIAMESLRIWDTFDAELDSPTGFQRSGILYVTDDEQRAERWETWIEHSRQHQLHTQLLSSNEIADHVPNAGTRWRTGLWTPSDGRAEPTMAVPAIARGAQSQGASIHTHCAVRGLETSGGAVSAVVTERGRVRTGNVLLAGGVWSRLFCKRHGIALKQLPVLASVMRTGPAPDLIDGGLCGTGFALRKRVDGGYTIAKPSAVTFEILPDVIRWMRAFWPAFLFERKTMKVRLGPSFLAELLQRTDWPLDEISPFELVRILDPKPDGQVLDAAMTKIRELFPAFKDVQITERWGGMIDATPDALPVISGVQDLPGLHLATGFSGHGFGIGPGAGRLAAELITGATPCVDPEPFRYDRLLASTLPAPNSV